MRRLQRNSTVEERVASFQSHIVNGVVLKWPYADSLPAEEMAADGFYFDPSYRHQDNVTCFYCKKKESEWDTLGNISMDDGLQAKPPILKHLEGSPDCPFARLLCARFEYEHSDHFRWEQDDLFRDPAQSCSIRLRTFLNWPYDKPSKRNDFPTSEALAANGFYSLRYDAQDDTATCMYCGVSLEGWEKGDNVAEEHRGRRPDCYVFHYQELASEPERSSSLFRLGMKEVEAPQEEQLLLPPPEPDIDMETNDDPPQLDALDFVDEIDNEPANENNQLVTRNTLNSSFKVDKNGLAYEEVRDEGYLDEATTRPRPTSESVEIPASSLNELSDFYIEPSSNGPSTFFNKEKERSREIEQFSQVLSLQKPLEDVPEEAHREAVPAESVPEGEPPVDKFEPPMDDLGPPGDDDFGLNFDESIPNDELPAQADVSQKPVEKDVSPKPVEKPPTENAAEAVSKSFSKSFSKEASDEHFEDAVQEHTAEEQKGPGDVLPRESTQPPQKAHPLPVTAPAEDSMQLVLRSEVDREKQLVARIREEVREEIRQELLKQMEDLKKEKKRKKKHHKSKKKHKRRKKEVKDEDREVTPRQEIEMEEEVVLKKSQETPLLKQVPPEPEHTVKARPAPPSTPQEVDVEEAEIVESVAPAEEATTEKSMSLPSASPEVKKEKLESPVRAITPNVNPVVMKREPVSSPTPDDSSLLPSRNCSSLERQTLRIRHGRTVNGELIPSNDPLSLGGSTHNKNRLKRYLKKHDVHKDKPVQVVRHRAKSPEILQSDDNEVSPSPVQIQKPAKVKRNVSSSLRIHSSPAPSSSYDEFKFLAEQVRSIARDLDSKDDDDILLDNNVVPSLPAEYTSSPVPPLRPLKSSPVVDVSEEGGAETGTPIEQSYVSTVPDEVVLEKPPPPVRALSQSTPFGKGQGKQVSSPERKLSEDLAKVLRNQMEREASISEESSPTKRTWSRVRMNSKRQDTVSSKRSDAGSSRSHVPKSVSESEAGSEAGNISGNVGSSITTVTSWQPIDTKLAAQYSEDLKAAAGYLKEIIGSEYQVLSEDMDGRLTNFIAEMPSEELEMSIKEWLEYRAEQAVGIVRQKAGQMKEQFRQDAQAALKAIEAMPESED